MALVSRIGPDPKSAAEKRELISILTALRNNYPAALEEMRPTPEQKARYLAKPWLPHLIRQGIAAPEPLSMQGPIVNKCAEMLARKLFTALHYKEFGKILPQGGGILWRWYTNVQRLDGDIPDEFINIMGGKPTIRRTRNDLSDQFTYTFVKAADAEMTGYFASFRKAFAMLGVVDLDAEQLKGTVPDGDILRPLGVQTG